MIIDEIPDLVLDNEEDGNHNGNDSGIVTGEEAIISMF